MYKKSVFIRNNNSGSGAPSPSDDETKGYAPGSVWIDTTNDKAYSCTDSSASNAVWITGIDDVVHKNTYTTQVSSQAGFPFDIFTYGDLISAINLPTNHSSMTLKFSGNFAANTSNKTVKFYFGTVTIIENTLANPQGNFICEITIIRKSTTNLEITSILHLDNSFPLISRINPTVNLNIPEDFKIFASGPNAQDVKVYSHIITRIIN